MASSLAGGGERTSSGIVLLSAASPLCTPSTRPYQETNVQCPHRGIKGATMSATMGRPAGRPARGTYRHGDLRRALPDARRPLPPPPPPPPPSPPPRTPPPPP